MTEPTDRPPPPPLPYAGEAPPAVASPRNGLGTAALVLAIVGLISCWTLIGGLVFGLAAIAVAVAARGRVKRGQANNGGVAIAGALLGVVAIAASVVLGWIYYVEARDAGVADCLRAAGGDNAKIQECSQRFRDYVTDRFGDTP